MSPSPSSSSSAHSSSSSSPPGPCAASWLQLQFHRTSARGPAAPPRRTQVLRHTRTHPVCACVSQTGPGGVGPSAHLSRAPAAAPPRNTCVACVARSTSPPRVRNTGHRDNDGARRRGRPGLGAGVPGLPCGGRGRPAVAVAAGGGEGGGGAGPAAGRRGEAELAAARPAGAGEPARRRLQADVDHLQQRVLPGPRKLVERPGADCRGHLRGSHTARRVAGAPRAAGERDGGGGGASGPRPGEQTPRGRRAFSCGGGGRAED